MQQLRQRVIASYHLGPMDAAETKAYIEHRLHTVGWNGDPAFSDAAHAAIFEHTGGIPRQTNTLCDRLLLMGYLEEMHAFDEADVQEVIRDIQQEFQLPADAPADTAASAALHAAPPAAAEVVVKPEYMDERMVRLEKSIVSVLAILKKIVATPASANQPLDNHE
jgi:general secretion pathway protein A